MGRGERRPVCREDAGWTRWRASRGWVAEGKSMTAGPPTARLQRAPRLIIRPRSSTQPLKCRLTVGRPPGRQTRPSPRWSSGVGLSHGNTTWGGTDTPTYVCTGQLAASWAVGSWITRSNPKRSRQLTVVLSDTGSGRDVVFDCMVSSLTKEKRPGSVRDRRRAHRARCAGSPRYSPLGSGCRVGPMAYGAAAQKVQLPPAAHSLAHLVHGSRPWPETFLNQTPIIRMECKVHHHHPLPPFQAPSPVAYPTLLTRKQNAPL